MNKYNINNVEKVIARLAMYKDKGADRFQIIQHRKSFGREAGIAINVYWPGMKMAEAVFILGIKE